MQHSTQPLILHTTNKLLTYLLHRPILHPPPQQCLLACNNDTTLRSPLLCRHLNNIT